MLYKQNEDAIKSVKDRVISGVGIRFGSPETKDWDGEWFHSDSEVGLKNGSSRPYLMEHGFGKTFGVAIVGEAVYEKSAEGWLYQTTFLDNDLGAKAFSEVTTKAYRSSAGAAGHTRRATMEKGTMRIDTWLVAEQSATMFPADPENARITRTKSDFMLMAIKELLEQNREESEARMKAIADSFIKDTNAARNTLAEALTSLKESFSTGKDFVLTDEFLTTLEQVTQPIEIIKL